MVKRTRNPKTALHGKYEQREVAKSTTEHWNTIQHNHSNNRHEMRQKLINIGCDKVVMTAPFETKIQFSTDKSGNSKKKKQAYNKFQNKIYQLCRDNSASVVDRATFPMKDTEISLARCGVYTLVKTLSNHQNACARCREMVEAKSVRKAAGDAITATATVINDQNSVAPIITKPSYRSSSPQSRLVYDMEGQSELKPIGFTPTTTETVIIEKHYGEEYVRTVKIDNASTTMDGLLEAKDRAISTVDFIDDLIERLEKVATKVDEILSIERQMKLLDEQIKNIKESI